MNARIVTAAMHVPARVLGNGWFNELLGEDVDTWLRNNLGIEERRWCAADESTADLVEGAARKLLEKADLAADDIDLLIVATDTPEYVSPSTASVVQHRLGMKGGGTFDVNTACAGFVTAIDMAAKYIRADESYGRIMVIGAYAMSKFLNLEDKKTVTLFADGAAGVILEAVENADAGWQGALLHTEGKYHDWMGIYGGGTKGAMVPENFDKVNPYLQFVKKFPKEINPETWSRMILELLEKMGKGVDDVGMIFFTQININSIRETMEKLGLPMEKTHTVMRKYAYTGSACIPMALTEALEAGKVKKGDLLIFMGSGGGLAFATAAFRW